MVGTCLAEKISDFENAGTTERQRKISVPKSLLPQSPLNIKGKKSQIPSFIWCKYTVSLDRDYYFKCLNFCLKRQIFILLFYFRWLGLEGKILDVAES